MSNKIKLQNNNTNLQAILETINTLPEAADAYAVIAVIYPEGSTCTCSNGSEVLELDNTIGYGFFLVPEASEWIVTSTDGTNSKSQSVSITSEGQFESVKIVYQLILIAPTTAAIAEGYTLTNTTITTNSTYGNYIDFNRALAMNKPGDNGYISPTIDVTHYNTLKIKACLNGNAAASDGYGTVGLYEELPYYTEPNPVAGIYMGYGHDDGNESWGLSKAKEYTVDISELTGNYYFSGYNASWKPAVFYAIFE